MGKVTYVVEYEDGKETPVYSDMEVAGGRLSAVMWSDYRDRFFSEEESEFIRDWLYSEDDNIGIRESISEKLEPLTK